MRYTEKQLKEIVESFVDEVGPDTRTRNCATSEEVITFSYMTEDESRIPDMCGQLLLAIKGYKDSLLSIKLESDEPAKFPIDEVFSLYWRMKPNILTLESGDLGPDKWMVLARLVISTKDMLKPGDKLYGTSWCGMVAPDEFIGSDGVVIDKWWEEVSK